MKGNFFKFVKHAAKRFLSSFSFMASLLILSLVICLSFFSFKALGYRECGILLSDGDENAALIAEFLKDNGFIPYEDREKMLQDVEYGEIDCAALILPDLTGRMEEGNTENCALFYVSSASSLGSLYREQLSSAIFKAYAPYMSLAEMKKRGAVPKEGAVISEYERYFTEEKVFSFNITLMEGQKQSKQGISKTGVGAIAIFTFAASLFGTVSIYGEDMKKFSGALGAVKTLKKIVIPACLLQTLLTAFSVAAGIAAAYVFGAKEALRLLPAALIYTVVLQIAGAALCITVKKTQAVTVFLTYEIIAALALCPVFFDIASIAPWLNYIRPAVIPYWLYYLISI